MQPADRRSGPSAAAAVGGCCGRGRSGRSLLTQWQVLEQFSIIGQVVRYADRSAEPRARKGCALIRGHLVGHRCVRSGERDEYPGSRGGSNPASAAELAVRPHRSRLRFSPACQPRRQSMSPCSVSLDNNARPGSDRTVGIPLPELRPERGPVWRAPGTSHIARAYYCVNIECGRVPDERIMDPYRSTGSVPTGRCSPNLTCPSFRVRPRGDRFPAVCAR